jgi:membrane fusion protein, multidrug efflux system
VGTDQGLKYLYVVDEEDKVVRRAVTLGSPQESLQVVADGLKPGERVIISGLQRVAPGVTVNPKLVPMRDGSKVSNQESRGGDDSDAAGRLIPHS